MMNFCDWQIKASAILGHWKMDAISMHVLPFKRQSFRLTKPGKQYEIEKGGVDGIVQCIDSLPPFYKVTNNPSVWLFLIPLDCHRWAFRQVMYAPGMVPYRPKAA